MVENDEETVSLQLECHCQNVQATVHVPASALPLSSYLCHCNSCNAVTGQLCATITALHSDAKLETNGRATGYKTSDVLERYFCGICGTSVYEDGSGMAPRMRFLDTGAFTSAKVRVRGKTVDAYKFEEQIFVGDSKDGGLRNWLTDTTAWEGWGGKSTSIPQGQPWELHEPRTTTTAGADIQCRCHCGGVQFNISTPTSGKYPASLCMCGSCRRATGFEVTAWAAVPDANMNMHKKETLKYYKSSPRAQRGFCGKCGATISASFDEAPGKKAIAVGLMNSKESPTGHRNEEILDWQTTKINHEQDAKMRSFASNLAAGLKAWGESRMH